MENGSTFNKKVALLPDKIGKVLRSFYENYSQALKESGIDPAEYVPVFDTYLNLVQAQITAPFSFQPYHQKIQHPFDYYTFGLDFIRPLVDQTRSTLSSEKHIDKVVSHLKQGNNVIFLANHQTEADPQAISILLEKKYPNLGSEMIFVAGERVITDPLAVPFSMGRNLLCIYSKRYIDNPPEHKAAKQLHNKRTMALMSELLREGGKCIYVAPSGGRDRMNAQGVVEVAPFDPQSIKMFYLMAQKAGHPTFFYPMALATYDLLPPPETIQVELGEVRATKRSPIHLAIGPELDMENFPGHDEPDKQIRRQLRADYIWKQVYNDYKTLGV